MTHAYNNSLFIFRRDLRLNDNTGLINALKQSKKVIACFIFDPQQISDKNKYYSANAVQFMIESIQDLDQQLHKHGGKLYLFHGETSAVVTKIIKHHKIDALFVNRDYTPFSISRDKKMQKICNTHSIDFKSYADALINEPEDVLKKDSSPYSVFSAFYRKASIIPVKKPEIIKMFNFFSSTIKNSETKTIYKKIIPHSNKNIAVHGGRDHGNAILRNLKDLKNYSHDRDFPTQNTSYLSAHLKFGTLSVREVYHAIVKQLGTSHQLLKQLYWRDFFTHIAFHFPTVFGHPFHKKYEKISWNTDKKLFNEWCAGKTGFPIVDAGMRQLNETGFMHNRVRMIVASFLTKDLHINWLAGEKYFAQQLVDYDPAVNNGNWQWCASTGCDAQPYFRIFNPWLQQKKFDPDCTYIKKWVPELQKHNHKIIHNWFKENSPHVEGYPRPIINHNKESKLAKILYKKVSKKY